MFAGFRTWPNMMAFDRWHRVNLRPLCVSALPCWSCTDRLESASEMRKVFEHHPLSRVRNDPWIAGYVGDRINLGDEFAMLQSMICSHTTTP